MTTCEFAPSPAAGRPRGAVATTFDRRRPLPSAGRELPLLAGLYVGYSLARLIGDADLATATAHADTLLRIESWLQLDVEAWANDALHAAPVLPVVAGYWYALLHYLVTPAVLLWAYRSRTGVYRRVRNVLVTASSVGLVGFTLVPMTPPRMLAGYTDTMAATSGYGWWGTDASAPKGLGSLTNELAAMPSLHVGWAVWCAWVVLQLTDRRLVRVAALAYPLGTVLVVVATANHWVLDAVAGTAVVAAAIAGVRLAARPGRRRA